jgi:hypothetical protein
VRVRMRVGVKWRVRVRGWLEMQKRDGERMAGDAKKRWGKGAASRQPQENARQQGKTGPDDNPKTDRQTNRQYKASSVGRERETTGVTLRGHLAPEAFLPNNERVYKGCRV